MVPRVDDLRLDLHGRAADVGRDVELADVEAQVVEAVDACLHAPPLAVAERLGLGEGAPQLAVPLGERVADRDGVDVLLEELARLQVHELADDVDAGDLEVVLALPLRERVVQVARLGVDEVRGERLGVAPEQRVREGHVTPVEADEVQAHEQHRERVDEARGGVGLQRLAEQRAVRQRELQVLGDEHGLERLAVRVRAARDHADGLDARDVDAAQGAQQLVLAVGDLLADLLDRDDAPGQPGEAHDVTRDAAREGGEVLGGPVLEGDVPRQVEQGRVGRCRRDLQPLGTGTHGRDSLRGT